MKPSTPPALRLKLLVALLPLALATGSAQAGDAFIQVPSDQWLLAATDHTDTHADSGHESGGKKGAGGQGQRKRLGKGAGTGEARGGHSAESDIFRDEGFSRGNPERGGGPPEGRGDHEDGDDDDHDHEDGEEGGGPPEGRGGHEDGEEHDHEL